MTSEVTTQQSSARETIKRIGPSLVVASVLGSTLGIVVAQFLDDLGDGILALILGGDAVIYNNRVDITGASDLAWAGGFLLCLIVGFAFLFAYPTARGQGTAKLTLLWMLLHVLAPGFRPGRLPAVRLGRAVGAGLCDPRSPGRARIR